MNRASDRLLGLLCLICGAIFLWHNHGSRTLHPVSALASPRWHDGLLQSEHLTQVDGVNFLCRTSSCTSMPAWPSTDDPTNWLKQLGQHGAQPGVGERPDAPALIRSDAGWVILWGERSDRLEVVLERRGAGVWPRQRFDTLYGLPWWGPLR